MTRKTNTIVLIPFLFKSQQDQSIELLHSGSDPWLTMIEQKADHLNIVIIGSL